MLSSIHGTHPRTAARRARVDETIFWNQGVFCQDLFRRLCVRSCGRARRAGGQRGQAGSGLSDLVVGPGNGAWQ